MTEQKPADVVAMADRCVVIVCTAKKFRRPENPKRCSLKLYHVWRWFGGPRPPRGHRCQCGALGDLYEGQVVNLNAPPAQVTP